MQSLTEFKRALKVGVKLSAIHHLFFNGRNEDGTPKYRDNDLGTREISIVQSNSFAFRTERENGDIVDSWCDYPKASNTIVNEDGITILEEQRNGDKIAVLTYKFIQ